MILSANKFYQFQHLFCVVAVREQPFTGVVEVNIHMSTSPSSKRESKSTHLLYADIYVPKTIEIQKEALLLGKPFRFIKEETFAQSFSRNTNALHANF